MDGFLGGAVHGRKVPRRFVEAVDAGRAIVHRRVHGRPLSSNQAAKIPAEATTNVPIAKTATSVAVREPEEAHWFAGLRGERGVAGLAMLAGDKRFPMSICRFSLFQSIATICFQRTNLTQSRPTRFFLQQ